MSSIFLSHTHKDKAFARRLGRDLKAAGVRVWIDEAELLIGDSLIGKIQDAIDEMDYLGVILSPSSVDSAWVQREVKMAMSDEINERRVKVLPILLSDCEMPGFLRDKLYADFRSELDYEDSRHQLLRRLNVANPDWENEKETHSETEVESSSVQVSSSPSPLMALSILGLIGLALIIGFLGIVTMLEGSSSDHVPSIYRGLIISVIALIILGLMPSTSKAYLGGSPSEVLNAFFNKKKGHEEGDTGRADDPEPS